MWMGGGSCCGMGRGRRFEGVRWVFRKDWRRRSRRRMMISDVRRLGCTELGGEKRRAGERN